jgi:SAM-dependent methyltransferase
MGTQVDPDAFNAFEAAGWDERATTYHRTLLPLTKQIIEPLLDAAAVGPGTRVLDVGSGPGYVAAAAAARDATAVGVDVAPAMVALARTLHPQVEFVQGDAEHLRFADDSFDAVVGNFVILHLGRPEPAVAECARVLAPGGKLALSLWDVPAASRMPGVFFDAVQDVGAAPPPDLPTGPPMFRFADEAEFTGLLGDAGLVDVTVSTVAFTYHYVGDLFDCLLDGTVRARGLVLAQPEATRARIRAALDRLSAEYATDGGFDLPISVKVASGRTK